MQDPLRPRWAEITAAPLRKIWIPNKNGKGYDPEVVKRAVQEWNSQPAGNRILHVEGDLNIETGINIRDGDQLNVQGNVIFNNVVMGVDLGVGDSETVTVMLEDGSIGTLTRNNNGDTRRNVPVG